MALLEASHITHSFREGENVLDDIGLTVQEGEFASILGPSGSGKTTLLSVLGGIERPKSGTVVFDGVEITSLKERELAVLRRTKLSYVFQFFNLAPYLTAEENILVPIMLNGKNRKSAADKVDELLALMGIEAKRRSLPSEMSGGEQQRVAIARGLVTEPKLILLDEPTGNLDSRNSEEIMKLLTKVNKELGTTVIQVTHSAVNAQYGDKIFYLTDGKTLDESLTEKNAACKVQITADQ